MTRDWPFASSESAAKVEQMTQTLEQETLERRTQYKDTIVVKVYH